MRKIKWDNLAPTFFKHCLVYEGYMDGRNKSEKKRK